MNLESFIEYVRANPKLVKLKESSRYPGLYVIKYTKTAFFGGAWNRFLEDSRGTVVRINQHASLTDVPAESYEIAALPFRKIYNYGIDKESPVFPLDTVVEAHRKVNGFMLAITPQEDGTLLFSTTGSLDSEFVDMGREVFDLTVNADLFRSVAKLGYTYMFECVHQKDPHIIPEQIGLYYLGRRALNFDSGVFTEGYFRENFSLAGCRVPFKYTMRLCDLLDMVKTVEHEGFVFYTPDGQSAKLKSPYYLAAKMFARSVNVNRLLQGKSKEFLDEEYYGLIEHVRQNEREFSAMNEQDRLKWIRQFFGTLYN